MQDLLETWLNEIQNNTSVSPADIPKIDLYMDQVLTFLEDQLGDTKRNPEDKVMTKTMINNYSKEKLLPPSNKKKYSIQHIQLLNLIYQFKSILSIHDIYVLLTPYIQKPDQLQSFYEEYLLQETLQKQALIDDVKAMDAPSLRQLASSLVTRATLEARLAEKILDHLEATEHLDS